VSGESAASAAPCPTNDMSAFMPSDASALLAGTGQFDFGLDVLRHSGDSTLELTTSTESILSPGVADGMCALAVGEEERGSSVSLLS
jgi:hypothetical protein